MTEIAPVALLGADGSLAHAYGTAVAARSSADGASLVLAVPLATALLFFYLKERECQIDSQFVRWQIINGHRSTVSIPAQTSSTFVLEAHTHGLARGVSLSPHPQSPFTLALGVTTPSQPGGRSSYGRHTRAVSAWDRWPLFWKHAL